MIVLDASAAVEWLLGLPRAAAVESRLLADGQSLHAPHLLTVETAQVLRRFALRGAITAARGRQALEDLADLDVALSPHEPLFPAVWRWRDRLTAYDAVYLALATALDATLLTLDAGLARAAPPGVADLVV